MVKRFLHICDVVNYASLHIVIVSGTFKTLHENYGIELLSCDCAHHSQEISDAYNSISYLQLEVVFTVTPGIVADKCLRGIIFTVISICHEKGLSAPKLKLVQGKLVLSAELIM